MTAPAFLIAGGASSASFASSITLSLDVGTGSNRSILVEVTAVGGASASVVNSITVGGVALTLTTDESLLTQMGSAGRFRGGHLQGSSIPSGTQNIVATMSDGNSKLTMIVTVYDGTTAVSSATLRAGSTSYTPTASATATADQMVAWMALTSAIAGTASIAATSPSSLRRDETSGGTPWFRMVSCDRIGVGGATATGYTVTGGATPGHSGHYWVVSGTTGDTTAPTLSSPAGTGGTLTCSGSVSTNEANGSLYAVFTGSATAPTAAQVKLGQDHTGTAALRAVGPQSVSATGTQTIGSGSCSAGTRYVHFMHEDAAANQSAVVSSASFTVSAAAPTTATLSGPSSGTTAAASTNFTVTLNAAADTTYTITPAGTNGTVTFSPSSPSITAGQTTVTFTANAALDGLHDISITTSPSLTIAGSPVAYTTSSLAGFDFHTDPYIFGDLAGGLTGLTRETSIGVTVAVYAIDTTTVPGAKIPGTKLWQSGILTTDSNGKITRQTNAAFAAGTEYMLLFVRQADGQTCAVTATAT